VSLASAREVMAEAAAFLIPPPELAVSDWIDSRRVIGRGYPSPFPGPWRMDRTPYLREPTDAFNDPSVETIVLHFSSQIGKTEMLMNTLFYAYGADPGPGMFVMPTLDLASAMSTDRLALAVSTCPGLELGSNKARTSDNSVLHKRINGVPLTLAGANSAASLSSRPIRDLWCDEIDRWPASTPEGDPLRLARQRTAAFRRRKIILASSPTIKGASRIEDEYNSSDKRVLIAPCPRCKVGFEVMWSYVRWTSGQPETAHIECPACEGIIEDHERADMFAKAWWEPTAPFRGKRGYRTWAIVSPWLRLEELVEGFLSAKDKPETLQTWVNLIRGETWEVPSEKIESASLLLRRQSYSCDVPAGAMVLTAGVDTQDDRLEALVMGWGPGEESWVIARESIFGDPQIPGTWLELDQLLARAWAREAGGTTRIQCVLVDALGHRTAAVYTAVVARQRRRVYASIGKDGGDGGQVVSSPKTLATTYGNVIRYIVDASQVKGLIYSRLKLIEETGAGVCHFPMSVGDAFFTELTSEHLVTERNKYGVSAKKWAIRPGHTRNETLDCFGMALAAQRIVCPTPARFAELAQKLEDAAALEVIQVGQRSRPTEVKQPRTRNWIPG